MHKVLLLEVENLGGVQLYTLETLGCIPVFQVDVSSFIMKIDINKQEKLLDFIRKCRELCRMFERSNSMWPLHNAGCFMKTD